MDKSVAIIILNYNSDVDTIRLSEAILTNLPEKYFIVIVDNDSKSKLNIKAFVDLKNRADINIGRLIYIQSTENGGYAKGNNIGLRWAVENGFEIGFIANPDIEINDFGVFEGLVAVLNLNPRLGMIGPEIENPQGVLQMPPRNVFRRMFYNFLYPLSEIYSRARKIYEVNRKGYYDCYTVHGCFFGLKFSAWKIIDFFDEATFLYHEESIIAEKLRMAGNTIGYCKKFRIKHCHDYGQGVEENIQAKKSWEYYSKNYLRIGKKMRALINF